MFLAEDYRKVWIFFFGGGTLRVDRFEGNSAEERFKGNKAEGKKSTMLGDPQCPAGGLQQHQFGPSEVSFSLR